MLQQILNNIYTPFLTGLVGYVTNKLAIKMLFRPYEAKWYTLGWQGIVPKTRPFLAKKIAEVVSKKLVAHDDIYRVISDAEFKNFIQSAVSSKISNINDKDIENIILKLNIKNIIEENSSQIDNFGQQVIDDFLSKPASEYIKLETIIEFADNIAISKIYNTIKYELDNVVNSILNSEKKIEDILPDELLNKEYIAVDYLTNSALNIIKNSGNSEQVKNAIVNKIIDFKNSLFNGNPLIKMGLELFLTDETIANMVKKELPSFINKIAEDKNIRNDIASNIQKEIKNLISMTPKKIFNSESVNSENIKLSIINKISLYITQDKIREIIINKIKGFINEKSDASLKDLLKTFNIYDKIKNFKVSKLILSYDINNSIHFFSKQISLYLQNNNHSIASNITGKLIEILQANLKAILENINLERTVENKINSLALDEVEDLLFSFMRTHFKWINILGFVIGFFVGCIQMFISLIS